MAIIHYGLLACGDWHVYEPWLSTGTSAGASRQAGFYTFRTFLTAAATNFRRSSVSIDPKVIGFELVSVTTRALRRESPWPSPQRLSSLRPALASATAKRLRKPGDPDQVKSHACTPSART